MKTQQHHRKNKKTRQKAKTTTPVLRPVILRGCQTVRTVWEVTLANGQRMTLLLLIGILLAGCTPY